MLERPEYTKTLFDRHRPTAWEFVRALGYGVMVFAITVAAISLRVGFQWWTIPIGVGA